MEKAMILLEDYKRAERELNNFMEINSTIYDLEIVRFLQEEVHLKYLKYIDYIEAYPEM